MDRVVPKLVPNTRLKTTQLSQLAKTHRTDLHVQYDRDFDALRLLVIPADGSVIIAHYVDGNVALLYRESDYEVIGLQIEAFERSFLPGHEAVRRVWRLSDSGVHLKDMGDLYVRLEKMNTSVAREVVEAARSLLGEPGDEFIAALA